MAPPPSRERIRQRAVDADASGCEFMCQSLNFSLLGFPRRLKSKSSRQYSSSAPPASVYHHMLSPTPKASSHLGFGPRWSFHAPTTHRRYPGVASRHSRWSTQHARTRLAYGIGKAVFSAGRVCPLRFLHGFHSLAIRRGVPSLIHDPLQARFSRRISFLPP